MGPRFGWPELKVAAEDIFNHDFEQMCRFSQNGRADAPR